MVRIASMSILVFVLCLLTYSPTLHALTFFFFWEIHALSRGHVDVETHVCSSRIPLLVSQMLSEVVTAPTGAPGSARSGVAWGGRSGRRVATNIE